MTTRFAEQSNRAAGGLPLPQGCDLVVAVDTMVAGVHFPLSTEPSDIGYKALAVNLSDLAAMGAEPIEAVVALVAPSPGAAWLSEFESGFNTLAGEFDLAVAGAGLSVGDLVVTVQVYGLVPSGLGITRSGARRGDHIFVTGSLGDAGVGLGIVTGKLAKDFAAHHYFEQRLARPTPRVHEGIALREFASSAIDLSDGLVSDLSRVLSASGTGASLDIESLPLSPPMEEGFDVEAARGYALSSGDDYELCFTCAPAYLDGLANRLNRLAATYSRIGVVEDEPGIRGAGANIDAPAGYEHFT